MNKELLTKGKQAKAAAYELGNASTLLKNKGLLEMAKLLLKKQTEILVANERDLQMAKEKGISQAMLDRLTLNAERLQDMAEGLRQVAGLPDPIGEVLSMWKTENELQIGQKRVPLGVIGMIYEARPNVTCDAAGLCLKTGNAVILRGGSEAIHSNMAIVAILREALKNVGLPVDSVQMIENTSRELALEMMRCNTYIDVLIPRGGAGLIQSVVHHATVPVIETGIGNCHVYVDSDCDLQMAKNIVVNAKTSRPAVCNAAEKLLIHEQVAVEFLPKVVDALEEKNVEIRADEKVRALLPNKNLVPATKEDWYQEYLDYIIGVKVVANIDAAIAHINQYGSKHSEVIVTNRYDHAQKFLQCVDAAAVYVNASSRFTDGGEFGFGAEIGISTQKLHARGPMGLKELTTIKYIIYGNGQIR
ncbi:MAG TPA: glutamate-5-semialdehyde dehydrogenase [Firmicutes bacterium]|nr:glutamate-5-semialdehyde dehydrogenase [Bacillales bacterium]HJA41745.1 glutamate-5-semialdehyde dehydrogenase [Bacillota bacterium]